MEQHPIKGQLPSKEEQVILEGTFRGKYRVFATFLICCGLLLAAFAVSAVWLQRGGDEWLKGLGSFWNHQEESTLPPEGDEALNGGAVTVPEESESNTEKEPVIPKGATPIVSMDLSRLDLGTDYIHNETPYTPNVDSLLAMELEKSTPTEKPLVLILHTHTSEAYLPQGMEYIEGKIGDTVYSRDVERNVISVGEVLCDRLNENGITAIHCTVMHDDPTLSGSYDRSEETVRHYLQLYPSIEYVIDLHRDSVTTSDGGLVRAVNQVDGESVAQVLAVIGTDCNGTVHENWEENLALALQLRELLNADGKDLCRPVSLRKASFHQELAKHALLLEIGTAANSVEEAKRAAVLVADALSVLIYER